MEYFPIEFQEKEERYIEKKIMWLDDPHKYLNVFDKEDESIEEDSLLDKVDFLLESHSFYSGIRPETSNGRRSKINALNSYTNLLIRGLKKLNRQTSIK